MPKRPIVLLVTALLAVACGGERPCAGTCGTAVIITSGGPDALLPGIAQSTVGVAISDLLFLKLADIGLDMNTVGDAGFAPRLARSWHYDDSLTLVFQLDPRAHWADGVPVSAGDVAFTFDFYRDTLINAPARSSLDHIRSVTARDSLTAVFRFDRAYPEQFYDATYQMRVLPRHLLDTIPRATLASHPIVRSPVGDGPYRLVRWVAGQSIEVAADTAFFLGKPGVARFIWRVVPDPTTAISRLLAGDGDAMENLGLPENVARVKADSDFRTIERASSTYLYIGFNLLDPVHPSRPHPIFGDRDVRRALTMAVDRQAIIQRLLGGLAAIPPGPVSRMESNWNDSVPPIPFDTARAGALLDAAGWRRTGHDGVRMKDGKPLAFDLIFPNTSALRRRAALMVQDQLRAMGVTMNVPQMDFQAWLKRSETGRFDATFGSWSTDPSPASVLQTWTAGGIGGFNYQHYVNPAFDRLAARATETNDPAAARTLWRQAMDTIVADAPAIWMFCPTIVAGVHARFTNVVIPADQWSNGFWQWHIIPGRMIDRDRMGGAGAASPSDTLK